MPNNDNPETVSPSNINIGRQKVVFSFVFLNQASAQAFAVAVEGEDGQVAIDAKTDGAALCTARVWLLIDPHPDAIVAAQSRLTELAEGQEGRPNGWELQGTEISPSASTQGDRA